MRSGAEDACQKRFSWFFYWIPKMQKFLNLVDLVKSFPTSIFLSIYLQNLASIHPRTSLSRFAKNQPKVRKRVNKKHNRPHWQAWGFALAEFQDAELDRLPGLSLFQSAPTDSEFRQARDVLGAAPLPSCRHPGCGKFSFHPEQIIK